MSHRAPTQILVATLFCLAASPAGAIDLPVRATIGIAIPTLPVYEADGIGSALGNPAQSSLHLLSLGLASNLVSRVETIPVTDPAAHPIRGLKFTAANDPGFFAESTGGAFLGAMPVRGTAKVCLFGTCDVAVANITVPLHVIGVGGSVAVQGPVNVTVAGAPWTTGSVFVGSTVTRGGRGGPGGAQSATAQLGGLLNLVTPIYISTNIGAFPQIDSIGRLSMVFEGISACDVELDQTVYGAGDTVQITRLQVTSERARRSYRMRLYLHVDVGTGFEIDLLDQSVTLGFGFDEDLAPVDLVTVGAEEPRTSYRLGCSLTDLASGEQHGDEAAFSIE